MGCIIWQWVQDIDTLLSLFSFFVTLYVLYEVHEIKKTFFTRARLPEYLEELKSSGSKLSVSLDQWPTQRHAAHEQIKISVTLLTSSRSVLPKEEKIEIDKIIKKLNTAKVEFHLQKYDDVNNVWDLYSDIQLAITSMTQLLKNIKWK